MSTMLPPIAPRRVAAPLRFRAVARPAIALLAAFAVAACSDSTGPDDDEEEVRGAVYELQTVNGNALPARFEPADDESAGVTEARIASGLLTFRTNGTVTGVEQYTEPGGQELEFDYTVDYEQAGTQVLIYSYGEDIPPDTGTVNGNILTVRAQFFRATIEDRYVIPMVYTRQ